METNDYKDKFLIKEMIKNGDTLHTLAAKYNKSIYTMSKYFSAAVEELDINDVLQLSKRTRNLKTFISPKTKLYNEIVERTKFLDENTSIRQRLWHIEHNIEQPPTCKMCENIVGWEVDKQTYRTYCSSQCISEDKDVLSEKRQQTNLKRMGVKYWNQSHIEKQSLEKLENREWLEHQHKVLKKSLIQIGHELNVHPLLPAQYLNRYGIPGQQNSQSETVLLDKIAALYDGKIIANDRSVLNGKELDVYLPDVKLAFEYNGLYWHSELAGKNKNYHLQKTLICNQQNINLVHIFEHDWIHKNNIVLSRISSILGRSPNTMHARALKVRKIVDVQQQRTFLDENHLQGYCPSTVAYGLYQHDMLVAFMSFGRPRFNQHYQWELLRFCNVLNTNVVGGASRLFTAFVREYDPNSIISYSNKSWGNGNLYYKLKFQYINSSKPNYYYFLKNTTNVYTRNVFQKHKLKSKLQNFDETLSEWQNMQNNGYNRIWDCGNDVFVWSKR